MGRRPRAPYNRLNRFPGEAPMNDAARRLALGLLLLAACAPCARAQFREEMALDEISLSGETPESIILLWPTYSYRLARLMIAKYGQPTRASDHSLVRS